jgi:septal ring factor EnvC (AmiA/AmiB activator)
LQQEFSITEEIQQELNLLQSEKLQLIHGYNLILIQYQNETPNLNNSTEHFPMNSEALPPSTQNSQESSTALQDLLNQGGNLFETLDIQLAELQKQLMNSETTITNLQTLLSEAKETITQLSENLIEAQKSSSEIDARLQNSQADLASAHEQLVLLGQQNAALKIEAEKSKNAGLIAWGFAGIGFGVGTPLMVEGIQHDNQTMLWAGAGTIIGTAGIWLLGHYVFQWWEYLKPKYHTIL